MTVRDWFDRNFGATEKKSINEKVMELSTSSPSTSIVQESMSIKERIALFFQLYNNDDFTFQLVNFLASRITHTFMFEGDPSVVKKLDKWAKDVNLGNKLEDMAVDAIVAGTAWIEAVPNKALKNILRIIIINPETMDFIRDQNNYTAYDEEGKVVGYEQQAGGYVRYWKKDVIEQGGLPIYNSTNGEDLRDRVKYLKICGRGDSELGLSLLGPGYRSAIIRANIADMTGEAAFRGGGIVAKHPGDMSPETKKKLRNDLKNITTRNIMIIKENITIDNLPIPDVSQASSLMYQLADFQASGMGIPMDLLIAGGRGYQRDLVSKIANMETRISSYQQRLAESVNDNIIYPLLAMWGNPASAKLKFVSASPGAQLNRARVIATLARRNLMTYDPELEVALRRELDLPHKLLDEVYKEWEKNGPPMVKPEVGRETNIIDSKDEQDIESQEDKDRDKDDEEEEKDED